MSEATRRRDSMGGSFIIDDKGTILGFDQMMENLTGWPAMDVVGQSKEIRLDPGGARGPGLTSVSLFDGDLRTGGSREQRSLVFNCRDGGRMEIEIVAEPLSGPGRRTIIRTLRVLSTTAESSGQAGDGRDPLTLLPDTDRFKRQLATHFDIAARTGKPFALIHLDIDHLREFNDRHGRAAGDDVLRRMTGILRVAIGNEDHVCRLGDDDFVVLLPGAGRGEARRAASGIRTTVAGYRFIENEQAKITVSLGAASFPADAESDSMLMTRAREALDEARSMGRNRVWCYLRRPRVPLEVPVYFDGAESQLVGYTRDLSPSGIFVQTSMPIEIGMRCAFAFPLPGSDRKVHVIGRVVRSVPTDTSNDSSEVRIPGMGVEFERFGGPVDRTSIAEYLHRHEGETLRPENGVFSV
ncbi:MAG: diguanylate cyclase [Acidobacteriota bacterium]|nr:diguanylate cyclase [Acidobacteriota bacterium]